MKIILEDVNYKGKHFDGVTLEMPNVKSVEAVREDVIIEYIKESLDNLMD
jgi:hypothetical protein